MVDWVVVVWGLDSVSVAQMLVPCVLRRRLFSAGSEADGGLLCTD
jgi:hypothetical protein